MRRSLDTRLSGLTVASLGLAAVLLGLAGCSSKSASNETEALRNEVAELRVQLQATTTVVSATSLSSLEDYWEPVHQEQKWNFCDHYLAGEVRYLWESDLFAYPAVSLAEFRSFFDQEC